MRTSHVMSSRPLRTILAGLLLATAVLAADGSKRWTITVKPSAGGSVYWVTSSPPGNGTIQSRGAVSFDEGAYLDLYFRANPGYRLISVDKDGQEFLPWLDAEQHFQFGPVGASHGVKVTFAPVLPTGTFRLDAPKDAPGVASMVDLTGSYSGVSPTLHRRGYAFDVAMDESGKLTGMGTVEGIEPAAGGPIAGSVGRVSTVAGEPVLDAKGKFSGTRDGVPCSGRAAVSGPAEPGGPEGDVASGSMTYDAKVGGVPFKDKNVPVQTEIPAGSEDNVRRSWSVVLDVFDSAPGKGRPSLRATARLTLPNGDVIRFDERKVRYSARKGLKVSFKKGTNISVQPNTLDRKSKLKIRNMTLTELGDAWRPTGGTIQYAFLGQKGAADLMAFVEED